MTGASARWSRLHVPVETGTPPYIVGAKSAPLCFRLSAKAKERRGAAAPRFAWASLQTPPTMLPPAGGSTMRLVYCDYTTPCGRSILQFREIYVPVNLTASLTGVSFARSRSVL